MMATGIVFVVTGYLLSLSFGSDGSLANKFGRPPAELPRVDLVGLSLIAVGGMLMLGSMIRMAWRYLP